VKGVALSCTGEGFGHASRTVAIAHMLRARYRVVIFCPRHLFPFMRENLGNAIELEEIPYFSFATRRERIDYARTVWTNLPRLIQFPVVVAGIARRLKRRRVDALISDYDPYGAYAADRLHMPILQINHPSVVLRQREFSLESWLARIVSLLLMGKYHRKLVVSFYDGDVGPIVRPSILETSSSREDFFVVYLKPSYRKTILRILRRLSITNVQVFPDPGKNIVDYLSRCKGVISSAGHQFMSEAMVLQKPVFVVPQTGQYEQLLNARMLEQSGWGTWARMEEVDAKLIAFVSRIDHYPLPRPAGAVRYRFSNDLPRAVEQIERFLDTIETDRFRSRAALSA
jgi:UDP:flavonoid glycosyltransferase YjiC (YdhE family)